MAARQGFAIEFTMRGEQELRQTLSLIASNLPARAGAALGEEALIEADEAERRAPIDLGDLRRSGRVHPWERDPKGDIVVRITFGSPSVPYAVAQHERFYRHPQGGRRKYLESVIRESRKHILTRVGRRLDLVP